jgi:hypothetical protein
MLMLLQAFLKARTFIQQAAVMQAQGLKVTTALTLF